MFSILSQLGMHFTATLRFHLIPVRMARKRRTTNTDRDMRVNKLPVGVQIIIATMEISMEVLQKLLCHLDFPFQG